MPELPNETQVIVEGLIEKALEAFDPSDELKTVSLLKEAWEHLPMPKEQYSESFTVMKYLTYIYFNKGDFKEAKKWADIFKTCHPLRNYGEQEFMAGKVAFELGDFDEAKLLFTIADQKSEGRVWEDADEVKYLKFYKQK